MKIDVVVPIYNAFEALQNCLNSLKNNQSNINQIFLINDASTEGRIKSYVNNIAKDNDWNVTHQTKNQGFVKTANLGLKQSTEHTVLLNSDTIVTKHWIKAFIQAIKMNPTLGTATPWSNNAEICSFPQFLVNHKLPANIEELAKTIYENHQPQYPILPTAVGFCMLVSKKAKQQVGYFDEQHFGHGYGEENDYSLRISQAGLKNILCDNAYVAHVGNQSFSDLGIKPGEETMQRLLQKHPNYLTIIQEYIEQDPLSDIRLEILSKLKTCGIEL
ncbi:MAG: glycosyltransferase family 2 protein [Proteobacteria bacterium]|nr:glycosyltransferase family 2 protein [Pseudomonadota bacterium]